MRKKLSFTFKNLFGSKKYDSSLKDIKTAEMIKPGDPDTKKLKKYGAKVLLAEGHNISKSDYNQAIQKYKQSIAFDNTMYETYYWRGISYSRLKHYKNALSDFNKAIQLNPRHFESYQMIDYTYMRDRQWDTIIGYWNNFLELQPDHAEAYLERGGALYHKGDLQSAVLDFQKSCQLGNDKACKNYEKLNDN